MRCIIRLRVHQLKSPHMSYNKDFAKSIFIQGSKDLRSQIPATELGHATPLFEAAFSKHSLDEELVDELQFMTLASIYGKDERPYQPTTLNDALSVYQNEAATSQEMEIYKRLFKGVNKSLPLPVTLLGVRSFIYDSPTITGTGSWSVCFAEQEDIVSINPKNLMKFLKYPEADAKALSRNILESGTHRPKMLKTRDSLRDSWNLRVTKGQTVVSSWRLPTKLTPIMLNEKLTESDQENIAMLADTPIPCSSLQVWKRIASRRHERLTGELFSGLPLAAQKRHIVNCIRHNSFYSSIYKEVEEKISKEAHDLAFDLINRKIIRQFPSLAATARDQLNDLHDGLR
ncbi:hypothetical protein DZF79_04405 [Vibrio parahaemolyticus]|nr:hypothetical protein [Vibrio parahaemolyticus]